MRSLDDHEVIRARNVKIRDILGLKTSRRTSIKCVFPGHLDGTPSLCIYPDNSFYCFGCGKSGQNAVDFCVALGLSFKEALTQLQGY